MIPIRLQLRNFMCYRGGENSIDFTGIQLAALTGDNGQGKSALLDAITWSLWGKARASTDELVTRGESEMEVHFEFDLNGIRYRTVRKRSLQGRGTSTLELQGRNSGGFFASLSEPSIRETQERINALFKLDYDTFINASFLLQNRADEFTTKRPGERKQILADILGLADYDGYVEAAKERAKKAEQQRHHLETTLAEVRRVQEYIAAYQEDMVTAEADQQQAQEDIRAQQVLFEQAATERADLDRKQDEATQTEQQLRQHREQVATATRRREETQGRLSRAESLLARAADLEAAMQQLTALQKERDSWEELRHRTTVLSNEAAGLQRTIDQARTALEKEVSRAEAEQRGFQKTVTRFASKEQELQEAERKLTQLQAVQQQQADDQNLLLQWRERGGQLRGENEQLREAMNEVKERMALMQSNTEATCIICRQPLSDAARAEALEGAQADGKKMGDRFRANQAEGKQAQDEVQRLTAAINTATRLLIELSKWQTVRGEALQAVRQMQEARTELARTTQEVTALRARLQAGDYAPDAQRALAELAAAQQELGYDGPRHDAVRQQIQHLALRQNEFNELATARGQVEGLREQVVLWQSQETLYQTSIREAESHLALLNQVLLAWPALQKKILDLKDELQKLQSKLTQAQRRYGAALQKLEDAEAQAARQPDLERAYNVAQEERALYDQLANAFGKKGIQAMLIESAVPDIERAANELLARMSNGRMSISIRTQRETKAGDPTETLDIFISDETGERPYETFSGGEAFRVNFALRIALSQLLAHRSGATLRTLVVDEGFGSQDAQGRERMIEAINSIRTDFDCIIIITHLDELKDAFDTRIDVIKDGQGSRVLVR